jgi:protoheme IX farnesyltransferase
MARTAGRPVPTGRVTPEAALGFGLGLSLISVAMLAIFANFAAAALLAFTIFFYVVIYSMFLKRRTPQNIVIGGAAGAFPPMIGWAVVTGGVGIESILMFLIIFMWTPPHFWALALYRNGDYARAGVPMMPVVAGGAETRRQILLYAIVLAAVAIAPAFTSIGGPIYLVAAVALNAIFVARSWRVARRTDAAAKADRHLGEKRLFGFSILYLFLVFTALAAQAVIGAPAGWPVLL